MVKNIKEQILEHFKDINFKYNDCTKFDTLKRMLDELEKELNPDINELIDMLTIVKDQAIDEAIKALREGGIK